MTWNNESKQKYYNFAKNYISAYHQRIDCADLAIVTLIEFAKQEKLPVKFKYYKGGWNWLNYSPQDDAQAFKKQAKMMLGALNVIDNTIKVQIQAAKSGDFIMSKWNNNLGHTRVIHSVTPEKNKFKVIWYQGNLPPVRPEKREDLFSNIESVYEEKPRRWNFEQFND